MAFKNVADLPGDDSPDTLLSLRSGKPRLTNSSVFAQREDLPVTPRMFGPIGYGNDSPTLSKFFQYLLDTGAPGIAPAGVFILGSPLIVGGGQKGLKFSGAGRGKTIFRRANFSGGTFTLQNTDHCTVSDFTVDGNKTAPGGTFGFGVTTCSHSHFARIETINCGTTGQWYISGVNDITFEDTHVSACHAEDCEHGGIQMQGARHSGISSCTAKNIGGTGDGTAIYFKVPIEHCYHSNNVAENSSRACSVGSSYPGSKGRFLTFNNIHGKNCATALRFGEVEDSVVNGVCGELSGTNTDGYGDGIRLEDGSVRNTISGVKLSNVASSRAAVRMLSGAVYNKVSIDAHKTPVSGATLASFAVGSDYNSVRVARGFDAPTTIRSDSGLGNELIFEGAGQVQGSPSSAFSGATVIASGAISLHGPNVTLVRVDTEGSAATDDLDLINGGVDGQQIVLCSNADARDITIRDIGGGNIQLASGTSFTLSTARDKLVLVYDARVSAWCEVSRSTN